MYAFFISLVKGKADKKRKAKTKGPGPPCGEPGPSSLMNWRVG